MRKKSYIKLNVFKNAFGSVILGNDEIVDFVIREMLVGMCYKRINKHFRSFMIRNKKHVNINNMFHILSSCDMHIQHHIPYARENFYDYEVIEFVTDSTGQTYVEVDYVFKYKKDE